MNGLSLGGLGSVQTGFGTDADNSIGLFGPFKSHTHSGNRKGRRTRSARRSCPRSTKDSSRAFQTSKETNSNSFSTNQNRHRRQPGGGPPLTEPQIIKHFETGQLTLTVPRPNWQLLARKTRIKSWGRMGMDSLSLKEQPRNVKIDRVLLAAPISL